MPNIIQKHYGLPESATAHRPATSCPGTFAEQLRLIELSLYLAERRGQRVRDCWEDARALVIAHARAETEE